MGKLFNLVDIRGRLSDENSEFPAQRSCFSLRAARDRAEMEVLSAALATSGRNMTRASEMLGVSRPTLYDLMRKHGLYQASQ